MKLSIVVPCYNEESVLSETCAQLERVLHDLIASGEIMPSSEIMLVDDGSTDTTWQLIEEHAQRSPFIRGIGLSRNRGHQTALLAGLAAVSGDAIISIDADLQDDISVIADMVSVFNGGADIVYGVRNCRTSDTRSKRLTAEFYYRFLAAIGVEVVFNHADYRLLSRRARDALMQYEERNLFLRGIIPQLGFPSATVHYERAERFAGESKYPLRRMLSFAWQGVTSFSIMPLRLITAVGFFVSIASVIVALWALWMRLSSESSVPGWASTVIPLYFLGGIQMLFIGVLGEYLGKIYMEVKRRPRYFVDRHTRTDADGPGR